MTEFTQDDLLRFLYGETSEKKTAAIKAAIKKDFKLRETYDQLRSLQNNLDEAKMNPSDEVINKIMKYAVSKHAKVQAH